MLEDVINILAANGDSGMLRITAGATEGVFFFKDGLLVDARVGDLKGFPAVNAAASMRDARFTFDPSVVPPSVSSITSSERVVLKQFFGIETLHPDRTVDNEVTLETTGIPIEKLPPPVPVPPASTSFYRAGVLLALLFCLLAVAAVVLRNKYLERAVPAAVATTQEPVAPVPVDDLKDLSGRWNVTNTVEKTSYRSYQDLKIGFDLAISQNGKSFTGKGEKVSENGRSLPTNSRTPIRVEGSIDGDKVEATFYEDGASRKSTGRFVWKIDDTGALNGTFASTAARSSGKSAARKS